MWSILRNIRRSEKSVFEKEREEKNKKKNQCVQHSSARKWPNKKPRTLPPIWDPPPPPIITDKSQNLIKKLNPPAHPPKILDPKWREKLKTMKPKHSAPLPPMVNAPPLSPLSPLSPLTPWSQSPRSSKFSHSSNSSFSSNI